MNDHSRFQAFPRPSSAQRRQMGVLLPEAAHDGAAAVADRPVHVDTIVLVEADDVTRRAAKRALQRFGYVVLGAEDGEQALTIIEERAGKVDLVVCDVEMPEISGLDLYQAVRARSDIRFVLVSAEPAERVRSAAGIDIEAAFLEKPWTLPELAVKVLEALD